MRVLQVSAEIYPLLKTGGLADVTGALPAALARAGCEPRVLLPGFPSILAGLSEATEVTSLHTSFGERTTLRLGHLSALGGLAAYVIDAPALYDRPGDPYLDESGQPHADNHRRFALLGQAASALAHGADPSWAPQVVHSHDWHAALANAYLALSGAGSRNHVRTVYTVHNLAYQGLFPPYLLPELGLPASAFTIDGLEFHGQVSFMKAGLAYADRVTTVSPSYAREIQTPEYGCGLDGLLRQRQVLLSGILNGVDNEVWNPGRDPHLVARYDVARLAGKARCKAALQAELGLEPEPKALLFGIVGRFAEQKGLPLLLAVLPDIVRLGGQLVLLGSGDAGLEQALRDAAAAHPAEVALRIGYDEPLAHRIFAATDVTLVPSRYEPCGLTQMYGLRYGSLPLVRRVGGLADTVVDCTLEDMADAVATGFVFDSFDADQMRRAVRRAFALYTRPAQWRAVQRRGMSQRFGWDDAARQYAALYRELVGP